MPMWFFYVNSNNQQIIPNQYNTSRDQKNKTLISTHFMRIPNYNNQVIQEEYILLNLGMNTLK